MEKTDYKITEFHNAEFGSIRMIEDRGRLLFSGIDVAFALGYAKPRNAINAHCKGAETGRPYTWWCSINGIYSRRGCLQIDYQKPVGVGTKF